MNDPRTAGATRARAARPSGPERARRPAQPRPTPRLEPRGSIPAPPSWARRSRTTRILLGLGLAATLALLLVHARVYQFLTDDAYISFRYARNLSRGFGLVFNPGYERVEGYSNFLYVLLLAGFARLGIAPEAMAHVLSIGATVVMWGLVVWFAIRRLPEPGREWLVLVPPVLLAATRSVAVWSTSGLETRWFETLLVAGALRTIVEIEARLEGRPFRSVAPWLFALAAWTRPDGLLLALCAFGATAIVLATRRRLEVRRFALDLLPFAVLVGGHFLFRRAYYGYWLPNTYYAKVGGQLWWDLGIQYLAAFVLEYAIVLWVPLLVLGVMLHRRQGTEHVPFLFTALIVPHALYVVAIGGDHFEYRPLDLYFPFLYLLMMDGARELLVRRPRAAPALAAGLLVILVGIWELPHQSHREFPAHYLPGFPGCVLDQVEAREFLAPERDPIYRLPGLSWIAAAYRDRIRTLSSHFCGLRQEEHRMFLATVEPDGRELKRAIDRGVLPRDAYVAMACVGAIPYYSDVRTLDVLGLTDAEVAHAPSLQHRAMAHDKQATVEYAASRGVDLWAVEGVHTIAHVTSTILLAAVRTAVTEANRYYRYYAADMGDGYYVLAYLLKGPEQTARRMPSLKFRWVGDGAFVDDYLTRAIAAYRERVARRPDDHQGRLEMAYLLLIDKQFPEAHRIYMDLIRVIPDNADLWENLSTCEEKLGNIDLARRDLEHALALAEARQDTARTSSLQAELVRFGPPPRRPPG